MSEPAKDEAELIRQISCAIIYLRGSDVTGTAAIAAIRAAGWDVVPVKPTWKDMIAAAPEVKP